MFEESFLEDAPAALCRLNPRHPSGFYSSLEYKVVIAASGCQGQVKAPRAVGHLCRNSVPGWQGSTEDPLPLPEPRAPWFCSVPVSPLLKSPEASTMQHGVPSPSPRVPISLWVVRRSFTMTLLHHRLCLLRSSCVAPSREPGDTCPVDSLALLFQVTPPPTVSESGRSEDRVSTVPRT